MATISECRYRWLRVPATTFVITHSLSRSDRRDRFLAFHGTQEPGDGASSAARSVTRPVENDGWRDALDGGSRKATLSHLALNILLRTWGREFESLRAR